MVLRLIDTDPGFEEKFAAFLARDRTMGVDVRSSVSGIIAGVRSGGFRALQEYTGKFDCFDLTRDTLCVSAAEMDAAVRACDRQSLEALDFAIERIRSYHEKQMPRNVRYTDREGIELGWRWTPVDCAGLYVPGGRAAYPSCVLMNAVPAGVAGVSRIVMVTPALNGRISPLVLAAARRTGIEEVYRIGGAQAVAALAYGAGPVPATDVIVGPGNAYVTEAKRQVFGDVGIDAIAGPSEILVVADDCNDPSWIAADLLSQAEHDLSARAVLITDSMAFAARVDAEAGKQLADHARASIAAKSWQDNSAIITVGRMEDAVPLVNRIAPEHLELALDEAEVFLKKVRHAGAVFMGHFTPEAIGDYVAGPSHVLPTGRSARFASGLGVTDFMKRTSVIGCSQSAFRAVASPAAHLADAEGLGGHALSVRLRLDT